ncbi:hypothetical protein GCM10010193_31600 [Kitasatospora atroaurantiaca]
MFLLTPVRERRLGIRRSIAVLFGAAALVGVAVAPASAGSGVSPCRSACDGQDPSSYVHYGQTCAADAQTIDTHYVQGRTVQLRYSNRCETSWARVYGADFPDVIRVQNIDTYQIQNRELRQGEHEAWTPMVDDSGSRSKACWWVGWATNNNECTSAY